MIEKLEIHHLRTLDALYKHQNTTIAAEHLNISQQAISLQLKKIRDILQDNLFVRSGHGVSPTPYAKIIEPRIHNILAEIHQIPLPDTVSPQSLERTLVISATDYAQYVIVKELINKLEKLSPKVRIIVRNIEVANLIKLMHQGEIDLAFTSHGHVAQGLVEEALFTETYRCVSANKALVGATPLSIAELIKHDFVITNPGIGSLRGSADAWLERIGSPRNVVISAPSFHISQAYLKQGNRVGFIPSRLLPCEGLFDIALEKYPPGYEVVMVFHPNASNDPYIAWLLELVKDMFKQSK